RAVLTTEGPPEAFAVEADRVQPALDAFASFLNGLAFPIQVLVRALPIDLASYARRLEDRAADLPPGLAASARADALWARQTGSGAPIPQLLVSWTGRPIRPGSRNVPAGTPRRRRLMPLLRLEAARKGSVVLHFDARADPLVAVARPATGTGDSFDARLAALGLRSLADLLAPPSLVIGEDYLALDGQYVRVLAVADLPPFVAARWRSGALAAKRAVD